MIAQKKRKKVADCAALDAWASEAAGRHYILDSRRLALFDGRLTVVGYRRPAHREERVPGRKAVVVEAGTEDRPARTEELVRLCLERWRELDLQGDA
jgi:hypothetical protein